MAIHTTIKNYLNKAKENVKGKLRTEFITPYMPKTAEEGIARMKSMTEFKDFEKKHEAIKAYGKGIMNEDMYKIMMKNIATRNAKKKKSK